MEEYNQKIRDDIRKVRKDRSITDTCVDWKPTKKIIKETVSIKN